MVAPMGAKLSFLTVSFSGAGHLLPYHLGVATSLIRQARFQGPSEGLSRGNAYVNEKSSSFHVRTKGKRTLPPIKAVSGSSAGAIAAVLFARLPHRIDEYADRFITERGRALHHLTEMLYDAERRESNATTAASTEVDVQVLNRNGRQRSPNLHVAVTRCSDGRLHLFSFRGNDAAFRTISIAWTTDRIMRCVEASCCIPPSFHPVDVVPGLFGGNDPIYPDEEGVLIDGVHYVDGGIAAPAPPTPHDAEDGAFRVIVSPLSGSAPPSAGEDVGNPWRVERISPDDASWNLLPMEVRCNGGFRVRPSVQNLRALRISMGAASGEELREWYERGRADGERTAGKLAS